MPKTRVYLCVDLKSFYASVECVERGLDPLTTHLVVADESRTEKTICLAVSPALKAYGIPGRARLFEVVQKVREANAVRRSAAPNRRLTGEVHNALPLQASPELAIGYLVAPPRMALYMDYSTRIYNIYLQYVAPEDIHVYSIDEVFMDLTDYLHACGLSAEELARKMMREVFAATGITATAGLGTNLYLCKIAMDIVAKHATPDSAGSRLATLDEASYRRLLWDHRPLTDFWRVGGGTAGKLEARGLFTMGDVARCSLQNEEKLYALFGVNAELLIDHAWGWESCTIGEIKAYKPAANSLSAGQVLPRPYGYDEAKRVVREMTEALALDLADKGLVADQLALTIGYDVASLKNPEISRAYRGEITTDAYGRKTPKSAHGTANLDRKTASTRLLTNAAMDLYARIADESLLTRRITLAANRVASAGIASAEPNFTQLDMFTDYAAERRKREAEDALLERERRMQETMLAIKKKFGKNALLKGTNLEEGATAIARNDQIGGHKA